MRKILQKFLLKILKMESMMIDKLELWLGTIFFYIEKYGMILIWALCLNVIFQLIRSV